MHFALFNNTNQNDLLHMLDVGFAKACQQGIFIPQKVLLRNMAHGIKPQRCVGCRARSEKYCVEFRLVSNVMIDSV